MQGNQPIDKGRVCVIAEKYPAQDQQGQQVMKNRYATVGRATLWPQEQGQTMPNIQIEIDTMPMGAQGPVKMFVFWDSENQNSQQPARQQSHHQQPAQQRGGYQQGRS
jgi:hypothetical protein